MSPEQPANTDLLGCRERLDEKGSRLGGGSCSPIKFSTFSSLNKLVWRNGREISSTASKLLLADVAALIVCQRRAVCAPGWRPAPSISMVTVVDKAVCVKSRDVHKDVLLHCTCLIAFKMFSLSMRPNNNNNSKHSKRAHTPLQQRYSLLCLFWVSCKRLLSETWAHISLENPSGENQSKNDGKPRALTVTEAISVSASSLVISSSLLVW